VEAIKSRKKKKEKRKKENGEKKKEKKKKDMAPDAEPTRRQRKGNTFGKAIDQDGVWLNWKVRISSVRGKTKEPKAGKSLTKERGGHLNKHEMEKRGRNLHFASRGKT